MICSHMTVEPPSMNRRSKTRKEGLCSSWFLLRIIMKASNEAVKDKALDSQLALSLIGRDAPNDLIVNRDFVTRIGNLCDVPFVRKLNISFNRIRSLDGIDQLPQLKQLLAYACDIDKIECLKAISKIESVLLQQNRITKMNDTFSGMSKLQELRLDQNRISKIEFLSGCVSLKKLDLSFNDIETLNGLSGLQQLQELKVSNNLIKSLLPLKALPSIKDLDVSNNQLKSLDGLQQMPTLEYVRADHNQVAELRLSPMMGSNKKTSDSAKEKTADKKQPAAANAKKGVIAEIADLSGPMLLELSVTGNRIRVVHGLEVYKDSLELLDLSSNNLASAELGGLLLTLKTCAKLNEVRMHGNPICEDDSSMDVFVAELSTACPALRAVDGLAIVSNSDARSTSKASAATLPGAYSAAMAGRMGDNSTLASGSQFHTWADDGTAMDGTASVGDTLKDEATEKDDLSDEDDADSDAGKENTQGENPDAKRYPHNLMLKEMLTPEQIQEKEAEIRNGLRQCKEKLEKAARTVFGFVEEEEEPEQKREFRPRKLLAPTPSESGLRVAAALDEAESVSRKQSAATVLAPSAAPAAAPVVAPERVAMKEKLVDRVRMAVSSSTAALDSPAKASAAPVPVRPATSEGAVSAPVASVPNNPLLTEDILASFRQHRESAAKDAADMKSSSPERLPRSTSQAAVSPGSLAESKSSSNHTSKTKAFLTTGPATSALGSGLTRYGTKTKPSKAAEAKSGDGDDSPLRTNVSILRASGGTVDSLDLLNLRITKPSQHVYMTEVMEDTSGVLPPQYPGESDNDSEDEDDGAGEEDEFMDDQELVDTQLEAVAEEDEEDEDPRIIDPVAAAHEVLFHEVKTRPDDRFGRAMVGVGGTGYDPRAVRRVLESAIGTTDSLPDQRPASVDAARALKRGHSAPNVETGTLSPPRLATPNVSNNSDASPPLSPAVSVGLSAASVISISSYQPRLHPAATTVLATGAGSISPRPLGSSASQPKLKFSIPQAARSALDGSGLAVSGAGINGKRGREEKDSNDAAQRPIDFAALERDVLRATAAGTKTTRNPTLPLPVAASGPFSPRGMQHK